MVNSLINSEHHENFGLLEVATKTLLIIATLLAV
jgi:hypothetical protein